MKVKKYLAIVFILIFAFSCKKTELTITEPGIDYILNKLVNGNWAGVNISSDGTLSLNGQNYQLQDSILGIGGTFANGNEYVIAAPGLNELITITTDGSSSGGVKEIVEIVGPENALGVITGIASSGDPSQLKPEDVIGSVQVTEEEKTQIENILGGLTFGKIESHPSQK